jgi:hypothetical protein
MFTKVIYFCVRRRNQPGPGAELGPGVALGPGAELDPDAAFTEIGTALDSFNLYPAKHLLSK